MLNLRPGRRMPGALWLLLGALGMGCSTAPTKPTSTAETPESSQPAPRFGRCGNRAWVFALDRQAPQCEARAKRWLRLGEDELQCKTDADCEMVVKGECDGISVGRHAAARWSNVQPPCFRAAPSGPTIGMCAPPRKSCEDGCCNAF